MKVYTKKIRKLTVLFIILIVLFNLNISKAEAIPFGGRILTSTPAVCIINLFIIQIPYPIWLITVGPPSPLIEPSMVIPFLPFIKTTIYQYYQFYRSGPWTFGTTGRFPPNPIIICPSTSRVTKIGTSLF